MLYTECMQYLGWEVAITPFRVPLLIKKIIAVLCIIMLYKKFQNSYECIGLKIEKLNSVNITINSHAIVLTLWHMTDWICVGLCARH